MTGSSFPPNEPVSYDSPWGPVVERLRAATIGEYDIGYELGRGGMAAVFLAYDLALARHVAIKVMSPALLMGEGMVERFRQEARTIANLTHPGIITIYAVRQVADLHFFVMRFIEGRSLEHILSVNAGSGVPIGVVRSLLHQVGSALGYAHRKGVVHRDVKPANILVDVEGTALVTDFGIAKVAASSTHTQTGIVVGTPAYISPEQCMGKPVDGHSDQYSLGVAAYEMLAGRPPFLGQGFAVMLAHASEAPKPLRELRPDCPPELEAAILRMLAKDPAQRFPTMGEALDAIGDISTTEDDEARAHLAGLAKPDETLHRRLSGPHSPVPPTRRRSSAASLIIPDLDRNGAINVGEIVQLSVSAVDASGWIVTDRKPVWSSSDDRIATVTPEGEVTARAAGEVHIIARLDALEAQLMLTIAEPMPVPVAKLDDVATTTGPAKAVNLSATMMGLRAEDLEPPPVSEIAPVMGEEEAEEATAPPMPVASTTAPRMPAFSMPVAIPEPEVEPLGDLEAAAVPATDVVDPEAVAVVAPSVDAGDAPAQPSFLQSPNVRRFAPWVGGLLAATILVATVVKLTGGSRAGDTTTSSGSVVATISDSASKTKSGASAAATGASAAAVVAAADSARIADSAKKVPATRSGPAPVSSIKIAGPSSLAVGEFAKLQASLRDTTGKLVTRRTPRWKALTPDIASIDTFGTIQARGPGKALFLASIDGKSDQFELTVKQSGEPKPPEQKNTDSAYKAAPVSPAQAMKSQINDCVQPLQSMDSERFDQYYAPANREGQRLVTAMADISSLDAVVGTVREPKINDRDGNASLEFTVKLSGGKLSGSRFGPVDGTIVAEYLRSAPDKWTLKHCRFTKLGKL